MGSISLRCGEFDFDLRDHNMYDSAIQAIRTEIESHEEQVIALGADLYHCNSIYEFAVRRGQEIMTHKYSLASGGPSLVDDRSAVCTDTQVFYGQGNQVACIDIETGKLVWRVEVDWATCFGLYLLLPSRALIVHGELSITKLWLDGDIAWQFGGRDIFTGPFQVHEDKILATDFDGERYTIGIADGHVTSGFDD